MCISLFYCRPVSPLARTWGTGLRTLVLLLLALSLWGCGSSGSTDTQVSGKVTVEGNAADPGSTVTFVGEGNKQVSTTIGQDGEYTILNPPLGAVQILVKARNIPMPSAGPKAPEGMKAASGAPIPKKYAQPNNGLTYTVVAGKQKHDIELTH